MANFNKRTRSANKHLEALTSAKFAHYTAAGTYTVKSAPGIVSRVILNTNGGTVNIRNASEVIGIIASDAIEGTYNYGVYCNDSIVVDLGGSADVTVVFA